MKRKNIHLKVVLCFILCSVLVYADDGEDEFSQAAEESGPLSRGVEKGEDANKGESVSQANTKKWVHLSGKFDLVSDYVSRGQTQTFGGPAAQGGFTLSQKEEEEGLYAGVFGTNVSNTIAANGAGLELDLLVGYAYKRNEDLSFKLELVNTRYPGAYASLPTKDSFDTLEIVPGVNYKDFYLLVAYCLSNKSGVSQNFAPTFYVPLKPNGNSKGSVYGEVGINTPVLFISPNLKFRVTAGYEYVRNYTVLNYSVYTAGLKYKLPEDWGGVSLFVNASATTANKKYYKLTDSFGKVKNSVAPRIWVGIAKKF